MTLPQAIGRCLVKYATFRGRASRSEFLYWYFFLNLVGIAWYVFPMLKYFHYELHKSSYIFIFLMSLSMFLIVPSMAVTIRRLHDVNRSGWWLLGVFVFAFIIIFFTDFVLKSFFKIRYTDFMIAFIMELTIILCTLPVFFWLIKPSDPGENYFGNLEE